MIEPSRDRAVTWSSCHLIEPSLDRAVKCPICHSIKLSRDQTVTRSNWRSDTAVVTWSSCHESLVSDDWVVTWASCHVIESGDLSSDPTTRWSRSCAASYRLKSQLFPSHIRYITNVPRNPKTTSNAAQQMQQFNEPASFNQHPHHCCHEMQLMWLTLAIQCCCCGCPCCCCPCCCPCCMPLLPLLPLPLLLLLLCCCCPCCCCCCCCCCCLLPAMNVPSYIIHFVFI